MKKILLMGNPNVGKSAIFSRLTGINAITSNYPGSTVGFTKGTMHLGDETTILIDAPGVYGLEPVSRAEEIAIEMLNKGDLVINVVDATNLERNLHLVLHILEKDIPIIIALNVWDDAQHKGIAIDLNKLEKILGVPVVPTVGISGEGIKELVERIPEAGNISVSPTTEEEKWVRTGKIVEEVQSLGHRHHTFLELLEDASVKPVSGLLTAGIVLFLVFQTIRFVGEGLISLFFEPFFQHIYYPVLMKLSYFLMPGTFLHDIFIGHLINGKIDFIQSFGVLSTGLFVPIAMVLPYVFSFYMVLGFLEDFGYLPRLAILLDNTMHRMGLHGWAIIPMLLGLGCNVPGIMATRILEERRERLIASTLISIGIPCASLQAMIVGLVGKRGGQYVLIIYFTLFLSWVVIGRILNKILKGQSPELIMEVPPYRMPSFQSVVRKLRMRMVGFLKEALPIVLLGVFIVDILYYLKFFDIIANFTAPVFVKVFGLPKEAVISMVIGLLRKDVAVGMLETIKLSAKQLVIAVTVLSMSFPCIATFIILYKELGIKDMLKSTSIMIISSLIVGGLLNVIL